MGFLVHAFVLLLTLLAAPAGAEPVTLSLTASPWRVQAGQRVQVDVTVVNQAAGPLRPGQLTVTAAGRPIAQAVLPELRPGESFVHRLTWTAQGQGQILLEARLEQGEGETAQAEIEVTEASPGRPDLALAWLLAPPKGCLGQEPWTAQVGVINQGQAPSRPGRLLFLVNQQAFDQAELPALAPGQQLLLSFTWRGARSGKNTLTALLDEAAATDDPNPANNNIVQEFNLAPCQPDLAVVDLKTNPGVEAGLTPLEATAVIANLGGGEIKQFAVRFFIDGQEVEAQGMGPLGPGQRRSARLKWLPPRPGTFHLAVEVDAGPGVREMETKNNRREVEFATLSDRPDLVLSRPSLPANLCLEKEPFRIEVEVANRGRKAAEAIPVILRHDLTQVAEARLERLLPGQSTQAVLTWRPSGPGLYRLFIVVDPGKTLGESDYANNSAMFQIKFADCRAELSLFRVLSPGEKGLELRSRRLQIKVANHGARASAPTTARLSVDGQPVQSLPLEPLEPNQARVLTFAWPEGKVGQREIEVALEATDQAAQVNRPTPPLRTKVHVIRVQVDLAAVEVKTKPAQPRAGQPFKVLATVGNLGEPATNVELAVYLDGRPLGRSRFLSLPAKVKRVAVLDAPGLAAGRYRLTFSVDPDQAQAEADRSNNVLDGELVVAP